MTPFLRGGMAFRAAEMGFLRGGNGFRVTDLGFLRGGDDFRAADLPFLRGGSDFRAAKCVSSVEEWLFGRPICAGAVEGGCLGDRFAFALRRGGIRLAGMRRRCGGFEGIDPALQIVEVPFAAVTAAADQSYRELFRLNQSVET